MVGNAFRILALVALLFSGVAGMPGGVEAQQAGQVPGDALGISDTDWQFVRTGSANGTQIKQTCAVMIR